MTGRFALFLFAGSVLPALFAASVEPAAAQCRLCEDRELIVDPAKDEDERVQLHVETMLDFDQIVVTGIGGHAMVAPDGTRLTEGGVSALSPRAMPGEVVIRGEPGRPVAVTLPERIELLSVSGSRIRLEAIESDLGESPRLDSSGELRFRFGGRLILEGDIQGDYRGDVPITAEYL